MLEATLARGLMGLGVAIGLGSVAFWALEVHVNVPDWIVRVAVIKLAFIAAGGMLVAGALLGRHAKTRRLASGASADRLGEGPARPLDQEQRLPEVLDRRADTPP